MHLRANNQRYSLKFDELVNFTDFSSTFFVVSAIECFECSSLVDDHCADESFKGDAKFKHDCSMDLVRGILPIQHCRKIKYIGNKFI